MQKTFFTFIIFCLSLAFTLAPAQASVQSTDATTTTLSPGDVVRSENSSTLYYIGDDNERHTFPSEKIYKSWYKDFSSVKIVKPAILQKSTLSPVSVTHKPGLKLVKLTTHPKVYAVGAGGILHWIKSELLAKKLYGNSWNKQVEDLPDQFLTNYEIGEDIIAENDYDKTQEEEAVPEIKNNLVNLKLFKSETDASNFNSEYTINYDLSNIEVAVAGKKTTISLTDIESGQAKVGTIELPAEVAAKLNNALSHVVQMTIAEKQILGIKKITMQDYDTPGQPGPEINGVYTERNQNFLFGKISSIDPTTKNCAALGGTLISGHFIDNTITNGKTTIGFIAGCKGLFLAARATISWTAAKTSHQIPNIVEDSGLIKYTNGQLNYSLQYPKTWKVDESGLTQTTKEVILGPTDTKPFTTNLSILLDTRKLDDIKTIMGIEHSETQITLAGQNAYKYIAKNNSDSVVIFIPYGDKIYEISTNYYNSGSGVQGAINSFVFTD